VQGVKVALRAVAGDRRLRAPRSEVAAERDPQAADWAVRSAVYGEEQTIIAKQDAVHVNKVRKRVERLYAWVRANTDKLAVTIALVIGGAWVWWESRVPDSAHPRPPEPPPVDDSTPQHRAPSLRSEAASECDAQQWRECLKSLDDARAIDPEGDAAPRVQALRREAEAAVSGRR
jgi:hypothetical protein